MDLAQFEMLDDALSGDRSTFLVPAALTPGDYQLCTANSPPDVCTGLEVRAD